MTKKQPKKSAAMEVATIQATDDGSLVRPPLDRPSIDRSKDAQVLLVVSEFVRSPNEKYVVRVSKIPGHLPRVEKRRLLFDMARSEWVESGWGSIYLFDLLKIVSIFPAIEEAMIKGDDRGTPENGYR